MSQLPPIRARKHTPTAEAQLRDTLQQYAGDVPEDLNLWPAIARQAERQSPFARPTPRLRLAFAALALLLVAASLVYIMLNNGQPHNAGLITAQNGTAATATAPALTLSSVNASPVALTPIDTVTARPGIGYYTWMDNNSPTTMSPPPFLPATSGGSTEPTITPPPLGSGDLQAIGISPAPDATRVPPDAPLAISFNRPIDRASAQFRISPSIKGESRWLDGAGGSTFLFIPAPAYAPSTTYQVSLSVADNGQQRTQAQLSFQTAPPAQVVRSIPADGSKNIPTDQRISFQFSRPMIPLTAVAGQQNAAQYISISPKVAGRFVWLSTTLLEFQPSTALAYGTSYTFSVAQSLPDQFGQPLSAGYVLRFSTVTPCIVGVAPSDQPSGELIGGYYGEQRPDCRAIAEGRANNQDVTVPPTTTVQVTFNRAVNHTAVEAAFSIVPLQARNATPGLPSPLGTPDTGSANGSSVQVGATPVAGRFTWAQGQDERETMTYIPNSRLALSTRYLVTIAAGGLPATERNFGWSFTTYAPLRAQYFDGGEQRGTVIVYFNNLLDITTMADSWHIEPAPISSTLALPTNGETSNFTFHVKLRPNTHYTITIDTKLRDIAGQALSQPNYNFVTSSSLADNPPQQWGVQILGTAGFASFTAAQPTDIYLGSSGGKLLNYGLWKLDSERFSSLINNNVNDSKSSINTSSVGLRLGKPTRSWQQPLSVPPDQPLATRLTLALDDKADRLPPGYYAFLVELDPFLDNSGRPANRGEASLIFFVGNVALTMKASDGEVLVWAVNQNDGKPVGGLPITLYSGNGDRFQPFASGSSDRDGLYRVNFKQGQPRYGLVAMAKGKEAAIVSDGWRSDSSNSDINNSNFSYYHGYPTLPAMGDGFGDYRYNYQFVSGAYIAYLYTERPIYRPGQTVYFKGMVRADDDAHYTVPRQVTAQLAINDGRNDVYTTTVALSADGSFSGQYPLAATARLGAYTLNLTLFDPSQVDEYLRQSYFYYAFTVQEYRKPDYALQVQTDQTSYISGETIHVNTAASYYFGASVSNAMLTARVTTSDYYFAWSDPATGIAYDFYDDALRYTPRPPAPLPTPQQLTTDAQGKATLGLPTNLSQLPTSQQYTIEAAVRDASNQEIASRSNVIVHKGAFYLGLHPDAYIAAASQPLTVSLVSVRPDATLIGSQSVSVILFARTWDLVDEQDALGNSRQVYRPHDRLVETKQVSTAADGRVNVRFSTAVGTWGAGEYVVYATARDNRGNLISTATNVYVAAAGFSATRRADHRVVLVGDQPRYRVGDTAQILVTSPYTTATALLTTERAGIRSTRVFRLSAVNSMLSVPIDDAALPNLYVSLTLVNPLADGASAPSLLQGYVNLQVDTSPRQLRLSIKPDKAQYAPGDMVSVTIKAMDVAGRPAQADVSFAAVDKAIFALLDNYTPTMLDTFYEQRNLAVRSASSLTIIAAQDRVYTSYSPTSERNLPATGGMGGGGGPQAITPRSDLRDTAYWQASVRTDANGTATLSFKLPDNTTTWQLAAKGFTSDTKVGETGTEILMTKPLVVRPILPRFLLPGDVASVGATVHNNTAQPLSVDVSLAITGTVFADNKGATQHLTLPANGEAAVRWQVQAGDGTRAGFTVSANAGSASDAVAIDIPINPLLAPEVTAQSGVLQANQSYVQSVFIPQSVSANVGQLVIHLTGSLAASALEGIKYTVNYQYACTEQTTSRYLPLLNIEATFKAAGQSSPYSANMAEVVNRSLTRIYVLQHGDGGWGYWEEGAGSYSYPYMTAFAVEGLLAAKAAGYTVDAGALQRGLDYLRAKVADNGGADGDDYRSISDPSTRAYVLDVLAQAGDDAAGRHLADLTAAEDKMTIFGEAHLVLGLVHSGQRDAAVKALPPLIARVKLQGASTAHWQANPDYRYYYVNMESDNRATALALQAILALDPDDELVMKGIRWLMQHRSDGHWASTQETTQVTISLARYVAAKHELLANFGYTAQFNGAIIGSGKFDATSRTETQELTVQVRDMLINQPNLLQVSHDSGDGPLYYNASLRYFIPAQGIAAYDNGLSVSRTYQPVGATANQPSVITSTAAGSLLHVRLSLHVPQDSYYVTIEDYIPAGMEAVNTALATTSSAAKEAADCARPYDYYAAQTCRGYDIAEMHDDRVTFFATFLAAGDYSFDYALRATTPGKFYALPTHAYLMYAPEVWGRSDSGFFTVTP